MNFEIIGDITDMEPIAMGSGIREVTRLRKQYGHGRWRKLQGIALIRLANGRICRAEMHWYETHGIGKREIKRKQYVDEQNATPRDDAASLCGMYQQCRIFCHVRAA